MSPGPLRPGGEGRFMVEPPADSAYIGALWEHPTLCVALFGLQFLNEEGRRLYEESGIEREMSEALEAARSDGPPPGDRKSTRLNSSHVKISYAVFCLKKKKTTKAEPSVNVSR